MSRGKKPSVRPELRRDWLYRHDSLGESVPEIATADGYDARTVRSQLETAIQERNQREAHAIVLRGAMEKHYADICLFAQKLDSHIFGEPDSLATLREDPMWTALKNHQSRSKIWKYLERWESLAEDIQKVKSGLRESIVETVRSGSAIPYPRTGDGTGIESGFIDAIFYHSTATARGETGLDNATQFKPVPAKNRFQYVTYGAYTIGTVPEDQIEEIENLFEKLLQEVSTWSQHGELTRLNIRLEQIRSNLHDELLVIILRRVVSGHCRYCPI